MEYVHIVFHYVLDFHIMNGSFIYLFCFFIHVKQKKKTFRNFDSMNDHLLRRNDRVVGELVFFFWFDSTRK